MREEMDVNRAHWDELVPIHAKSAFYNLDAFKAGKSSLDRYELAGVGDVAGRSLLHLQCHFGMDTMSWSRLGARATGVDFSEPAIELARSLADEIGLDTRFIRANIYELPEVLDEQFDVVFTSHGTTTWLPDIGGWGRVVGHFLKRGGRFFIVDGHPFAWTLDDASTSALTLKYSYFHDPESPLVWEEDGSYADPEAKLTHRKTFDWNHSISSIVNALIDAGLTIDRFEEYPVCAWQYIPLMVEFEPGWWKLPDELPQLPFMYSIQASKLL